MKPFLSFILILFSVAAIAQESDANKLIDSTKKVTLPRDFKQELRFGWGYYSLMYMVNQTYLKDMKAKDFMIDQSSSSGVAAFSITGFISNKISFAINLSVEDINGTLSKNVVDSLNNPVHAQSSYKMRVISFLPSFHYYWKQSQMLNLYSGFGIGLNFINYDIQGNLNIDKSDENSSIGISTQLTPIGIRYGNKYAGFAELGIGTLGFLRIGLSLGF